MQHGITTPSPRAQLATRSTTKIRHALMILAITGLMFLGWTQTSLPGQASGNDKATLTVTSSFLDVAVVDTVPCSASGYDIVEDCYNADNPPAPSIMRSLESAEHERVGSAGHERPIDSITTTWPGIGDSRGVHKILPTGRTSHDGRLLLRTTEQDMWLAMLRPETLGYGQMQDGATSSTSDLSSVNPLIYWNPLDSTMDYPLTMYGRPKAGGSVLCESSGPGYSSAGQLSDERNPRSCTAQNGGGPIEGDCYDVTLLAVMNESIDGNKSVDHYELRSVDVTAFVADGKLDSADDVLLFPRTDASQLGEYHDVRVIYPEPYVTDTNRFAESAVLCDGSPGQPGYCGFVDNQHRSDQMMVWIDGAAEPWNGYQCVDGAPAGCRDGLFFFELSITADGRLLVLNMRGGQGMYYSYNSLGACRADGWTEFFPISHMPWDPDITSRYDIGQSQRRGGQIQAFRDTYGRDIENHSRVYGAYGWIDREGKNLFFSAINEARDGYHAVSATPKPIGPDIPTIELNGDLNPDKRPGKGVVALGAWTQGKMVLLDNGLNATDFGGRNYNTLEESLPSGHVLNWYDLQLYQGDPVRFSMKAPQSIFSLEHHLFYFAAMNPTLPFDVVWTLAADNQRNTEVAFDEYLMNDAFLIAHMNAPIRIEQGQQHPDDGFIAANPHLHIRGTDWPEDDDPEADFRFVRSPKLHNAATSHPFFNSTAEVVPESLELRGGARVEPVALGGPLGHGVYLDGVNDFINTDFPPPTANEWFLSLWLDSRETDPSRVRTVFYFPDDSWIGMSQNHLVAHHPGVSGTQEMDLGPLGLTPGKYFHLAVKITSEPEGRALRFFIDGTPLRTVKTRNFMQTIGKDPLPDALWWPAGCPECPRVGDGFQLQSCSGTCNSFFVVGDPGPDHSSGHGATREPFNGWVDELRIYRLGRVERQPKSYFDEFTCNLALGTLVGIDEEFGPIELGALARKAVAHGLIERGSRPRGTVDVCEQMRLHSYQEPFDFPPQTGPDAGICIGRVHGNPHDTLASHCRRNLVHKTAHLPLVAEQPMPDFSRVDFCASCHHANATVDGLGLNALLPGFPPRYQDPRRRPMDVPATLGGCIPAQDPFPSQTSRCDLAVEFLALDPIFDHQPKVEPNP